MEYVRRGLKKVESSLDVSHIAYYLSAIMWVKYIGNENEITS